MVRKMLWILLTLIVLAVVMAFVCDRLIAHNADGKCFTDMQQIPKRHVAVVLGTSPMYKNGMENLFFTYRIQAAAELYKAGKVDFLILSGDNNKREYNEPEEMKKDLVQQGVPEQVIFLDYAGFRTLDSMVRAKEVFQQDSITIISQPFHNERAIYLAEHAGLEAVAFNAQDVPGSHGFKVRLREYLARVKMFIDLLFNKQPHFLGETIEIR
ncbi:MAG: YdcF family protein [Prevotella sp.]|nr:YdcF family protein [Prevotella sp.]